jgi:hypothetical protein
LGTLKNPIAESLNRRSFFPTGEPKSWNDDDLFFPNFS